MTKAQRRRRCQQWLAERADWERKEKYEFMWAVACLCGCRARSCGSTALSAVVGGGDGAVLRKTEEAPRSRSWLPLPLGNGWPWAVNEAMGCHHRNRSPCLCPGGPRAQRIQSRPGNGCASDAEFEVQRHRPMFRRITFVNAQPLYSGNLGLSQISAGCLPAAQQECPQPDRRSACRSRRPAPRVRSSPEPIAKRWPASSLNRTSARRGRGGGERSNR